MRLQVEHLELQTLPRLLTWEAVFQSFFLTFERLITFSQIRKNSEPLKFPLSVPVQQNHLIWLFFLIQISHIHKYLDPLLSIAKKNLSGSGVRLGMNQQDALSTTALLFMNTKRLASEMLTTVKVFDVATSKT